MSKINTQKEADVASKKDDTKPQTGMQIEELEKTIENLKQQLAEVEENWKRALADYKNLERRTIKEKEESAKFANFVLVAELLSVYDNLEMLKKHSEDKSLIMIADQFAEILENAGLTKIEVLGKDFDETYMEAVDTQEGEEENKVIEEVTPGYKFRERLIRPAKVVVIK
jgi:molecular chaperone GrpE